MSERDYMAQHSAMESRRRKAEEILDGLANRRRVVISGGPRTGKSTLAVRAGERYRRPVKHADSLIGQKDWSESSAEVAKWIDQDGDWIVEGVAAPRALRKWLAANPGKKLDATVVHFREPVQFQTDKQRAMSKGVETVWLQIRDELKKRGATVIEREVSAPRAPVITRATTQEPEQPEPEEDATTYTIRDVRAGAEQ